MDFYVVLDRQGYRVARRRRQKARVGVQHRVTKEDAIKWCARSPVHADSVSKSIRASCCRLVQLLRRLSLCCVRRFQTKFEGVVLNKASYSGM